MGHHQGHSFTDIRFPDIVDAPLDPARPFAVSAQATILRYFKEVLDARPHVMANDDIEAVHEIRVAARRTRTALQTFSTLWPDKDVRRWLDYLAQLADAFTIARDTDVLVEYLEKQLKSAGDKPSQASRVAAMSWLLQRAQGRRHEEQPMLEKLLRRSEKDHSAEAFVQFFAMHPVNLWHYNQPAPDTLVPGLLPEPQAIPEPEPQPEESTDPGQNPVHTEAQPFDPDTAAELAELSEEPRPVSDFVRVVLENVRRTELELDADAGHTEPSAEHESPEAHEALGAADQSILVSEPETDLETEAQPVATDEAEPAAEDGAENAAPRPFADIAHAVVAELNQLQDSDDGPSVEAARYHPQEGQHGQG